MNTTYAKSKIEKLMAINTCKTANQNEVQTAFDMARKVAEKYKVLTWFYLTYVNPVNIPSEPEVKVEPKVIRNEYDLCEEFRWPDICNVLFDLFGDEFASYLCQYSSRNGDYKHVYFTLSDDEFEFMKKAYKFVLKAKNRFCKETNAHDRKQHILFKYTFKDGFYDTEAKYNSQAFINARESGFKLRKMYEEFKMGC